MAQSRKKKIEQAGAQNIDALSLEGLEPLLENASLEVIQDFTPVLDFGPERDYQHMRVKTSGLARFLLPEPMDFRPEQTGKFVGGNKARKSPAPLVEQSNETRLILDLLSQLEAVNDLVLETGFQLETTRGRVRELEARLIGEDLLVEKIQALESEAQRIVELETWLEALQVENENLKKPAWKKVLGLK